MKEQQTMSQQRGSVLVWLSLGIAVIIAIVLVIYLMPEKVQYLRDVTTQAENKEPLETESLIAEKQAPTDAYSEPTNNVDESSTAAMSDQSALNKQSTIGNDDVQIGVEETSKPSIQSSNINHTDYGLALIMDDVGYGTKAVDTMISYGIPLTFSVLPDAPDAVAAANKVYNAGHIVMLHMPMEPKDPDIADAMMTKTGLTSEMNEAQMKAMVNKTLQRIPHVTGMSNHMGSMLTEQADAMRWLMKINREHGLFFIDSLTTANSIARVQAAKAGVPWASRRFFLDNDPSPKALNRMWNKIIKRAAKKGGCIVIFHPHKTTLAFLKAHIHEADNLFVPLSALLHQPH